MALDISILTSTSGSKRINFLRVCSVLIILLLSASRLAAQKSIPDDYCISPQEQQLFDKLNMLLEEYGKKPLRLSASLSYVARTHVEDLAANHPDTSICNLSSWSDKGEWTACCYNPYLPDQDCMWDKPKELTPYPYRGYELVAYFQDSSSVDSVIRMLGNTKQALDMLLANGNFENKKWVCMGVAMNEHYVSAWLGQRADKAKKPVLCDTAAVVPVAIAAGQENKEITYYLIVASFQDMKDAREALRRFKKNGFEHAGILNENQLHRVYSAKFDNLKEAMHAKKQLPYTYRDAWIFKK